MSKKIRIRIICLSIIILLFSILQGCTYIDFSVNSNDITISNISIQDIPEFSGKPYIEINNNIPNFNNYEMTEYSFEKYSDLDYLGRCTQAFANIGTDIMPNEERREIGHIKPSGWQSTKYDIVDGKYLYNRCHLIGYQLTGENANEKNLITGTRYLNVDGMLPFENMVAEYVENTKNHVLYRVTPIYTGTNLIADGVQMEALSVEDDGEGICFNIYVYNVQPGILIDYETGKSELDRSNVLNSQGEETEFIINKNSKKIHYKYCSSVDDIQKKNKKVYYGKYDDLIKEGYTPCSRCIKD